MLCSLTSEDVDAILNAYERKLNKVENKESEMKPLKHTAMYCINICQSSTLQYLTYSTSMIIYDDARLKELPNYFS